MLLMKLEFPSDFIWGTAISAFQNEMGSSKQSIYEGTDWYQWSNNKEIIEKGLVSGDKPQDGDGFWDLYKEDMKLARALGTNAIRMSIEWGRIFKDSTFSTENNFERNEKREPLRFIPNNRTFKELSKLADPDVVEHYENMIDYAHSIGLKVFMTLYHWPIPIWLHDPVQSHKDIEMSKKRGWLDISTIEEFAKYAYFASLTMGNKVDAWETINEPEVIAVNGYVLGPSAGFPPALENPLLGFSVMRNLSLAHNLAYSIFKKNTKIMVGIGTAPQYFQPYSESKEDIEMAETIRYLNNEWILNATLKGEFDNGLTGTPDEKINNFGGTDYIGIDYYSRNIVRHTENASFAGTLPLQFEPCIDCTDFGWDIYPSGMENVLKWIYEKYKKPFYILENGIADAKDIKRREFIQSHLKTLQNIISKDKIPVNGYFHWTLTDNYEWADGYSMKFGLYEVDFDTKERKRRQSSDTFEAICKDNAVTI